MIRMPTFSCVNSNNKRHYKHHWSAQTLMILSITDTHLVLCNIHASNPVNCLINLWEYRRYNMSIDFIYIVGIYMYLCLEYFTQRLLLFINISDNFVSWVSLQSQLQNYCVKMNAVWFRDLDESGKIQEIHYTL